MIILGVRYVSTLNTSIDTTLSSTDQVTLSNSQQIQGLPFSIECVGIVTYVEDGDTINIKSTEGFRVGETFPVRFADIDTPPKSTSSGANAKSALNELIYGEVIGLDINDLKNYDKYGRVVAVVYLQIGDSTVMNVNKWLVDNRYANIWDFDDNEFNPYAWQLLYDIS